MKRWLNGVIRGTRAAILLVSLAIGTTAPAQRTPDSTEQQVRQADAAFWDAFSRCDRLAMAALFTIDAESYHDKTGLNVGRKQVAASMMRGPCSDPKAARVRREAFDATIRFDPLAGGFALLSGEHRFFATSTGEPEQPSGASRFVTVWQRVGPKWLMRRVVSYAHGPGVPQLSPVAVTTEALKKFAGSYVGEGGAKAEVRWVDGTLFLTSGGAEFRLVPIGPGRFGVADRPVQFSFKEDELKVVENGTVAAHMRRTGR